MFSRILVCCLVPLIFVLSVEGVSIILNPTNIVLGSTDNPVTKFEVQCSSSGTNDIKKIYVLKILRRKNNEPDFIGFALITDVDQAAKDISMPLDIQAKSNVTGNLDLTSGTLTLTINTQGMSCSDDAEFQCLLNCLDTSNTPRLYHENKNLTVDSAPSNVEIVNPEYYVNGVSRPLANNSVLSTGTRIKFGCSANIGTNRDGEIIWEKTQTLGSSMTFIRYTPNLPTDIVDDSSQPVSCYYTRMSTMYYNLTSMDQDGVSFRCRVQAYLGTQPYQALSNQEYRISAVRTSGTGGGNASAGLSGSTSEAGVIAGAVIGAIAGVVLLIVLVYFLWYRKRSSGESYRTKEEGERPEPPPTDYTYSMPDKKKIDGYDNKGLEEPHEKTTRYPRSGRGGFDGRDGRNDRGHHNPGMDDEDGGTMHMSHGPIGTGV